jgi:hypothetical protein
LDNGETYLSSTEKTISGVENSHDFDDLFELVKRVVDTQIGKHRAGLSLVLSDMPNAIGAYHPVGSNIIVLNRSLINDMRKFVKEQDINSFVFTVLMHEYLHSLGLYDESLVRRTVQKIVKNALGEDHISVKMATGNWFEMYPQLAVTLPKTSKTFEIVEKFDSGSTSYLG